MTYTIESGVSIKIGTRMVTLNGKIPGDVPNTLDLSYHATSLDNAVCVDSIADAFNDILNGINDTAGALKDAIKGITEAIAGLNLPTSAPANPNPLIVLYKIKEVLSCVGHDGTKFVCSGFTGTDVAVYVTDILMRVSTSDGKPLAFDIGLHFKMTDAKFLNIEIQSAGIRIKADLTS